MKKLFIVSLALLMSGSLHATCSRCNHQHTTEHHLLHNLASPTPPVSPQVQLEEPSFAPVDSDEGSEESIVEPFTINNENDRIVQTSKKGMFLSTDDEDGSDSSSENYSDAQVVNLDGYTLEHIEQVGAEEDETSELLPSSDFMDEE